MSAYFIASRPAEPSAGTTLAELDSAKLLAPVEAEGSTLPAGSIGTVVGIWAAGRAYEVEFEQPFHAVVTVEAAKLGPGR